MQYHQFSFNNIAANMFKIQISNESDRDGLIFVSTNTMDKKTDNINNLQLKLMYSNAFMHISMLYVQCISSAQTEPS